MTARIEEIIDLLSQRGAHGYQELVDLANDSPHALLDLIGAASARLERHSTGIDAVLELIPEPDLGAIADRAVAALVAGADPDDSQAASLVAELSLQAPPELRRHLPELWRLHPNSRSYYAEWPWRAARDDDLELPTGSLRSQDEDTCKRAWRALLETRLDAGWQIATSAIGSQIADDRWAEASLQLVGIERQGDELRRLFQPSVCHIEFPRGFLKPPQWNSVRGRLDYPTWHLATEETGRGRFGGAIEQPCKVCDEPLHRLLALDAMPTGLEGPREVVTCLNCLGWSAPILYFQHGPGEPTATGWDAPKQQPEFPAEPLPETPVVLRRTPERWQFQDWAMSNSRQNLNRLGGEPTWIQSADFPRCPECSTTMPFLLQLDSLDIEGGPWWLWGSGGILYVFWCKACALTATIWQCT